MSKFWRKIGQVTLTATITAVITAAVNLVTNKFKIKTQTQAAIDLEVEKLKNAQKLEETRTTERIKRFEAEEEHRLKMNEIAEEQRRKHRESQQAAQEASNGVSNKTTDGPKKTKRTLTADEKAEIVMLLEQKVKSPVIAKQFKISLRTVQRIAKEARA